MPETDKLFLQTLTTGPAEKAVFFHKFVEFANSQSNSGFGLQYVNEIPNVFTWKVHFFLAFNIYENFEYRGRNCSCVYTYSSRMHSASFKILNWSSHIAHSLQERSEIVTKVLQYWISYIASAQPKKACQHVFLSPDLLTYWLKGAIYLLFHFFKGHLFQQLEACAFS